MKYKNNQKRAQSAVKATLLTTFYHGCLTHLRQLYFSFMEFHKEFLEFPQYPLHVHTSSMWTLTSGSSLRPDFENAIFPTKVLLVENTITMGET